jgi:methylthioribulose-1-phosphate dehydratase
MGAGTPGRIGTSEFQRRARELIEAGRELYRLGMVPATSGNFSARLGDGSLAITVSGRHKGRLTEDGILRVDADGRSLDGRRPSAETLLHVNIYRRHPGVGVVLHPHSVNATLISRLHADELVLQDYELLKAFPGVDSHDCSVRVPIFDNDQDIARLAGRVEARLGAYEPVQGYLIRGHGFYTWGADVEDAMRHVEAFEFLFDCELRMRGRNP